MAPTGYEPKINIKPIFGGNFLVKLGQYNVLVFNPKHFCRLTCCLHPKTLLLPKRNAILTFVFIVFCFVLLEYLASIFAARPLTTLTLLLDFGLVLGTVNAGIATSVTDPGIIPPELTNNDEDDENENENNNQIHEESSESETVEMLEQKNNNVNKNKKSS